MKRMLIKDLASDLYLNEQRKHVPRNRAFMFHRDTAEKVATSLYGPSWMNRAQIVEPELREYMSFLGRIGGTRQSPQKLRANRLNARRPRPNARKQPYGGD